MRTTIDIPDPLFRKMKSEAVLRGESLKSFLLRAVKAELEKPAPPSKARRAKLPIVKSKEKTYDVSPDRLAEILENEDHEILAGH